VRVQPNYALYLVTDRVLARGRSVVDIVREGAQGGVTIVQLREKELPTRAFVALARELHALLAPLGVPLIVNDRLDVALAAQAAGVHVGQDDMPVAVARRLLGPDHLLGVSVSTADEARAAEAAGADYLGVSPIFPTPTKSDTPAATGLAGLARIRAATRLPLVGIGGLNAGNAADVLGAGADGIAVVSAILSADDPRAAASELRAIVERARVGR
jgi:thiamine-phosphate pyrophosphorylase